MPAQPQPQPATSTASEIERHLRDHLGVETVIWLGAGVVDDETDGHVDNLACFVRPASSLLTWTDDRDDPQHAISLDARARLEAATDARGRSLEVHLLHQPGPLLLTEPRRPRASTASTGTQAAPGRRPPGRLATSTSTSRNDAGRRAAARRAPRRRGRGDVLRRLFPDREVVGVPAREILLGGGNIHCITQQVPSVPSR